MDDKGRKYERQRLRKLGRQMSDIAAEPAAPDASGADEAARARHALGLQVARRHRFTSDPIVRASIAVLVLATVAGLALGGTNDDSGDPAAEPTQISNVAGRALASEVALNLPQSAGTYAIVADTLGRDEQGVFHWTWREMGAPDEPESDRNASASVVRLAMSDDERLVVDERGEPTLYLKPDSKIPLVASVGALTGEAIPTATIAPTLAPPSDAKVSGRPAYVYSSYDPFPFYFHTGSYWSPFTGSRDDARALYRAPASSSAQAGETLRGSVASERVLSSSVRATSYQSVPNAPNTISGIAHGSGGGTAITNRTGGFSSAVSAPKSSGFSAGRASISTGAGAS